MSAQQFETTAAQGYCPVHRHPSFVESYTSILAQAFRTIREEIDLNAVDDLKEAIK